MMLPIAIRLNAADLINIKLAKSGGLFGAAAIDATAAAAGVPCMVGCNAETRLGTAASAHFIAAHENVHYGDIDSSCCWQKLTGLAAASPQTVRP